ncbi:chloride channel CLIC-like protein 1 [Haliotis rufescens]|uniref:chloride channel CLIC-like protein 1 n=1 Tax=Haliotis rufescens TaxID=6454 RepID=UPI00201EC909|nr:chloride channel CLIC-like protein 1 [Haliotis rufescens]
MAAKMKRRKFLWLFVVTISILFVFLVLYLKHKLGQLECTAKKGPLPFQKYLLMLKKLIFGTETEGTDKKSLLCGKDINEVCMHILTRQLPQDAKYYLVEFWEKDPELREFVFRILVVVGLVSLTIFCNFCRWMTATELHYDDDYEEKTIQSNLNKKASENSNYKPSASQRISDFKQVNHNISHSLGDSSTSYPSARREEGCRSWNVWKIMGVILAVLTILSIPWEFIRLYQKEVSKRAAQALQGSPPECFPSDMSVFQSLRLWVKSHFSWDKSTDPCEKYYYTMLVDPLWELTPLLVLSSALTRCILHPIEKLSSGLGRSFRVFFAEIPAQWQPIIMVLLLLLALVLLLLVFSYRISIPLLFRVEPKTPVQDKLPLPPRMELLSNAHGHCDHPGHVHHVPDRRSTLKGIPMKTKGRRLRLASWDNERD